MSWPALKKLFSPADFTAYVGGLSFEAWKPQFVVHHNTASPTVAEWPSVAGDSRMRGLEKYYSSTPPAGQGWSGGPHLFVAPEGIWAFNPLTEPGVHSPSWNGISWGVETVGDFSREYLGDAQKENLVSALATLHEAAGLDPAHLRFHFEDPATTHRGCPGAHLVKADVIAWVQTRLSPLVT